MGKTVDIPEASAYAMVAKAANEVERYEAGQYAMALVDVDGCSQPVPRFMLDLPWSVEDEGTVDAILTRLASAADIEAATQEQKLRKPDELVGRVVTILDVRAHPSDLDDAKWGAYLSLAVSVDGGPQEVVNTGHGQVCVTVWRLYAEGKLPATGTFVKLGTPTKGRNQPLGFRVESKL